MRSFAVVAGFAAVALAAPQYEPAYPAQPSHSAPAEYPAYPAESSSAPAYEAASSSAPAYAASSSAPSYEAASSSAPAYAASSSAPAYAASSSAPAYQASSSAPAYTTTEVVHATTYVCPEPTVITHGPSTYTISTSTTLHISEYTATYVHTPTPEVPTKPTATHTPDVPVVPKPSETHPAYSAAPPPPAPIYPSSNGTVYTPPAGTGRPTGTGAVPSTTKPSSPEFTGAAGKATVGFFAMAGALAAFL